MIAIIETIHKAIEPPEDVCSLAVSFDFSSFTSAFAFFLTSNVGGCSLFSFPVHLTLSSLS